MLSRSNPTEAPALVPPDAAGFAFVSAGKWEPREAVMLLAHLKIDPRRTRGSVWVPVKMREGKLHVSRSSLRDPGSKLSSLVLQQLSSRYTHHLSGILQDTTWADFYFLSCPSLMFVYKTLDTRKKFIDGC